MYSTIDLKMEKPFYEVSASCDSPIKPKTSSPRNALNESYTISKCCNEDKYLTIIYEENSECGNDSNMIYFNSFSSVPDLSECKNTPFVDQGTKQISVSPECKKEINNDIDYDSDESMGLLPDLLLDFTNDSFILCKDYLNDLNTTVNVSDKYIGNFIDCSNHDLKCSSKEFVISPVCNKTNISCTQTESPVYCNQSVPIYASTPKHEISYSNVIDEEIASPQNMLDCHLNKISQDHIEEEKDCLNKTTVIETDLNSIITSIPISSCLDSEKNVNTEQNILNKTCNMTKPRNVGEISLNKTFETLDALVNKDILPSIVSNTEQCQIIKPNVLNTTFEHHCFPEFDPDLGKENVLNLTCHIVKESDSIGTASGEFSECSKDIARDILNTTVSYPYVHNETELICSLSENKSDVNIDQNNFQPRTGDILNSTYEKIDVAVNYDLSSEKLKCITNLEEKRPPQLETVSKQRRALSFSAKNLALEKTEFKNKGTEFKRNENIRSSIGCFGKSNVTKTDSVKQTCKRRSLSSSICPDSKVSEIKENLSFPKSLLPKHAANIEDKSSLINGIKVVNMSSSYLNKTITCVPLKFSDSKSRDIKDIVKMKPKGSQEPLLNVTINLHSISGIDKTVECSSTFSNCMSKDIQSLSTDDLKGNESFNTTISLPTTITEGTKFVIKKPRNSMLIRDVKESCLDSCLSPPINDGTKTSKNRSMNSMLINDSKENCVNSCLPSLINDATKTVIKKPRHSMLLKDSKKNCLDSCLPSLINDTTKTVIKKPRHSMLIKDSKKNCFDSCLPSLINDATKTVIKKPRHSILIKDSKESCLDSCLPQPISDATRTVIKNPRNSMLISNTKESCLNPCKLTFGKDKSAIPSFQKKVSMREPQPRVKDVAQESNEHKTSALTNKIGLKDANSVEEKVISRLPQKTLSQKTKFQSDSQSSSMKPSSNLPKPQSITGFEPPTTSRKSLFTLSKNCSNKRRELAGKAILNGAEQNNEVFKKFTSSSKIPSISGFSRQEKTSLLTFKKSGVSICKSSQLDSR